MISRGRLELPSLACLMHVSTLASVGRSAMQKEAENWGRTGSFGVARPIQHFPGFLLLEVLPVNFLLATVGGGGLPFIIKKHREGPEALENGSARRAKESQRREKGADVGLSGGIREAPSKGLQVLCLRGAQAC